MYIINTYRLTQVHYCTFIYSDVDECSDGTHVCTQTCTNTNGSFICGCKSGYLLDTDEFTCNGKHKPVNLHIHTHTNIVLTYIHV